MSDRDMSEVEAAAGIEPLDILISLHRKRRAEFAALWAKYGTGGVADHLRKSELSRIKEVLRATAATAGTKVTEAALDDGAHDHPDYRDFLALAIAERAKFFEAEAALKEVEWRINRGQGLLRYVATEPR